MKSYKQLYFVLKDVHLSVFKDENEADQEDPMMKFNLKGREKNAICYNAADIICFSNPFHSNTIHSIQISSIVFKSNLSFL